MALVDSPLAAPISEEQVISFLKAKRSLLDGVVLTGGEPTIQDGLEAFLRQVRKLRLAIKIDTNGTDPFCLASLIDHHLVDYIALDLKGPPEKLTAITGVDYQIEALTNSIALVMNSYIEQEFRITVLPEFSLDDVLVCAKLAFGARRLVLQQFQKPDVIPEANGTSRNWNPHPASFFLALQRELRDNFEEIILRNVDLRENPHKPHPTAFQQDFALAVGE